MNRRLADRPDVHIHCLGGNILKTDQVLNEEIVRIEELEDKKAPIAMTGIGGIVRPNTIVWDF